MIEKKLTVDEYIDDPVNTTMINERCIELALGIRYMQKVGNDNLTEVGCVMPHYGYCEHPIIDLFSEDSPAGVVQNVDAEECDFSGKDVLCLSTVEHIGRVIMTTLILIQRKLFAFWIRLPMKQTVF